MSIQRVRSKWAKTDALLADPRIRDLVPESRILTRGALQEMLEKRGMVYVKPINGTFGKGVIRVEKVAPPFMYQFQSGTQKHRFVSFDDMYRKLLAVKQNRRYMVQQGVHLLKYGGRRFDLRVMVQKNARAKWETTGLIGRLAHPRKIVTNYHSGGTPMPVDQLLKPHVSKDGLETALGRLRKLGTDVAAALEKRFPRLKEIGVDVAMDRSLKTWVLEVNTMPDPYIFRKHPNRAVFRRIYRYAVGYGRFRKRRGAR